MLTGKKRLGIMWLTVTTLVGLAFYSWGQGLAWQFSGLSAYQFFPLLGLTAWFTMFTHYVWGALSWRSIVYTRLTGYFVLGCILLHPGLLGYAQYKNGLGNPPFSFYRYFPPSYNGAVLLGSTAVVVFLSFEVFNRLKNRPKIKRIWKWVSLSQAIAMTLIFVHALYLGDQLHMGWLKALWIICGIILLPCMYILLRRDFTNKEMGAKI